MTVSRHRNLDNGVITGYFRLAQMQLCVTECHKYAVYCSVLSVESLFRQPLRDPTTKHTALREGHFAQPACAYRTTTVWIVTENVGGTNIRVHEDGEHVTFAGKTDRTETPTFFRENVWIC